MSERDDGPVPAAEVEVTTSTSSASTGPGGNFSAPGLATPVAQAQRFLDAVFALPTPGRMAIVRAERGRWMKAKQFSDTFRAACFAITASDQGFDVYFGVGRNTLSGHTAAGVFQLNFAWVDVDCVDVPESRGNALAKLEEFHPAPSIINSSAGGFHGYWLLDTPADPGVVRRLNVALAKALGSDRRMHADADAVLRIPGTRGYFSHKQRHDSPRTVASVVLAPDRRYNVEDLAVALDVKLDADHVAKFQQQYPSYTLLLKSAATHLQVMSHGADGRLRCLCPFHDDHRPSAVLFANGWFHCSACGVNEPAPRWTRRAQVRGWAAALTPRRGQVLFGLPLGYLRMPRVGLRNALSLLAPFPDLSKLTRRRDGWGRWSPVGDAVVMEHLGDLRMKLRHELGPFALKVWLACISLAQEPSSRVHPSESIISFPRPAGHAAKTLDGAALLISEVFDARDAKRRPDHERVQGLDLMRVIGTGPHFEARTRGGEQISGIWVTREGVLSSRDRSWIAPYAVVPRTQENKKQLAPPLSIGVEVENVRYDSEAQVMFAITVNKLARLLGYRDGPDGRPQRKVRQAIRHALDGLRSAWVTFKLSSKAPHFFDGPLLHACGRRRRDGALVFMLHPGVRRQLMVGPAWSPWHSDALAVHNDATLMLYLEIVREMWERRKVTLVIPLELMARRAGMWNAARASKNVGAYLATWARRVKDLEARRLLRGRIQFDEIGRPMLHAQPSKALRLAIETRNARAVLRVAGDEHDEEPREVAQVSEESPSPDPPPRKYES